MEKKLSLVGRASAHYTRAARWKKLPMSTGGTIVGLVNLRWPGFGEAAAYKFQPKTDPTMVLLKSSKLYKELKERCALQQPTGRLLSDNSGR